MAANPFGYHAQLPAILRQAVRRLSPVLAVAEEWLFPPNCLLCERSLQREGLGGVDLCGGCRQGLAADRGELCPRCARPLPRHATPHLSGCGACRNHPWRFDRAIAVGIYGGLMRETILRIKQPRDESLCLVIGAFLGERVAADLGEVRPDLVVPVPMHWWRRMRRGVNDAELLAEGLARRLRWPCETRLLRCRRVTRKQGMLLPDERKRNVRDAYEVVARERVQGLHVLLVDDVMTTGATLNELARVLRQAGAQRVSVAVVARGIGY